MLDFTNPPTAEQLSAEAQFSIQDYGRVGDQRPYQIIAPAYPAPKFLQRHFNLDAALNECRTMCQNQGIPFRILHWGATGTQVPCRTCPPQAPSGRFPRPIIEVRPTGEEVVFRADGKTELSGVPHYVVSRIPFPPLYQPGPPAQRYLEAVKTAQLLADREGRRAYVCSGFGAKCLKTKTRVPVVYVDPGGLRTRYPGERGDQVTVTPVSPEYFRELVQESKGASFLPQNA